MKKNLLFVMVIVVAALLMNNACKKDKAQAIVATANVPDTCSAITFTKTIMPIITTSCATGSKCHGAGSSHNVYSNYASISSEVTNGFLTVSSNQILGKGIDMTGPLNGNLTQSQINQFICWLNSGAPNN